jgi:hypothetical protein
MITKKQKKSMAFHLSYTPKPFRQTMREIYAQDYDIINFARDMLKTIKDPKQRQIYKNLINLCKGSETKTKQYEELR